MSATVPGGGMLRALRSRNYRLFFAGQLISLIGTWMQTVAHSWLVYSLTGSIALLDLVGFCNQIPVFLLAPRRPRGRSFSQRQHSAVHAGRIDVARLGTRGTDLEQQGAGGTCVRARIIARCMQRVRYSDTAVVLRLGAPATVAIGGAASVITALLFGLHLPQFRVSAHEMLLGMAAATQTLAQNEAQSPDVR